MVQLVLSWSEIHFNKQLKQKTAFHVVLTSVLSQRAAQRFHQHVVHSVCVAISGAKPGRSDLSAVGPAPSLQ